MGVRLRIILPSVMGIVSLPLVLWDIHNGRVIESMGMAWDTGAPIWPYQTSDILLRLLDGPAYYVTMPFANALSHSALVVVSWTATRPRSRDSEITMAMASVLVPSCSRRPAAVGSNVHFCRELPLVVQVCGTLRWSKRASDDDAISHSGSLERGHCTPGCDGVEAGCDR
jgi:hypothetical protein